MRVCEQKKESNTNAPSHASRKSTMSSVIGSGSVIICFACTMESKSAWSRKMKQSEPQHRQCARRYAGTNTNKHTHALTPPSLPLSHPPTHHALDECEEAALGI